jgi:GNAT superfamily N-acetyltransferase
VAEQEPIVRRARPDEAGTVSSILQEAVAWLEAEGIPLWTRHEVSRWAVADDVAAGTYWVAEVDGEPAGVMRFQLEDPEVWPDAQDGEAAYLHRLAVRRRHSGGDVSTALLRWAAEKARAIGRRYLRLDVAEGRHALYAIYEEFGFRRHSGRMIGPHKVVRYQLELTP